MPATMTIPGKDIKKQNKKKPNHLDVSYRAHKKKTNQ